MTILDPTLSVPKFFQGKNRYDYWHADEVTHWSPQFRLYKKTFDISAALVGIAVLLPLSLLLLLLNPFLNPGPLFYRQERLGYRAEPFTMWKFRTMTAGDDRSRSAEDGVEAHRITRLGRVMRKLRIDELPNFINVLKGEMSVIGPRPDAAHHAREYAKVIPHYAQRFKVRPGITGLAQIEAGYAEGAKATAVKAAYDQIYVETSCGRLDVYIALRTVGVMATGFGAR